METGGQAGDPHKVPTLPTGNADQQQAAAAIAASLVGKDEDCGFLFEDSSCDTNVNNTGIVLQHKEEEGSNAIAADAAVAAASTALVSQSLVPRHEEPSRSQQILTSLDASAILEEEEEEQEGTNNTESVWTITRNDTWRTVHWNLITTTTQQRILDNGCPAYIVYSNAVMPL